MKSDPFPKPRLADVAREVGVSLATVSRALNGVGRVKQSTRFRILRAAEALQQSRSPSARNSTHRLIGLFSPWYSAGIGSHTNITQLAQDAIHRLAEQHGYALILSFFGDPENPTAGDRLLDDHKISGVILYRTKAEESLAGRLREKGVPFVIVNRKLEGTDLNWVGLDHTGVVALAVRHALSCGYRDLGILFGDPTYPNIRAYRDGFLAELARSGVTPEPSRVREAGMSEAAGYEATADMLRRTPPRAIICCNDRLAFGALRAAADNGKRIPKDLAVISLEGTDQTAFTTPPLTVVRLPWVEMFSLATSVLLEMIALLPRTPRVAIELQPELIVRDSTIGD